MSYDHVLVILKGYLGDAVMATPLLAGLVEQSKLDVHVLTTSNVISLLQGTFPSIHFHTQKKISHPFELIKQAKELRSLNADAAIVVNRSFRSALVAWMAKIPVRVGHISDLRSNLLTKSIPYEDDKYEVSCYLDLAELAGIHLAESHPALTPDPALIAEMKEKLQGATVGIQPGARHGWKRLPLPLLIDVVKQLQKEFRVVLLGGAEEQEYGEELSNSVEQKPINLIGQLSLSECIAATSQLKAMIGGDTGLMHIAAAAGCPTVTMFGPHDPAKWGHTYKPHQVLRKPDKKISSFTSTEVMEAVARVLCP